MPSWTVEVLLSLARLSDPQMRPDGEEFAWVRKGEIHVSPLSNPKPRAVQKGSRPRWSPDSKTLAFLAGGQVNLWDEKRNAVRVLTVSPSPVSSFQWSPDGKSIGYLAMDAGKPADPEISGEFPRYQRLFLQQLDAKQATQLTAGKHHVVGFALSGTGVVYAAQNTPRNQDSLQTDLFTVNLATRAVKPLVQQPGRDGDPSYSPDGKWIAFHTQGGTLNYYAQRDVAIIPADGGEIRYLTRGKPIDVFRGGNAFTWTSDGAIIYSAGSRVKDVLIRQDLGAGGIATLTEGIAGTASFTADRKKAVFLKVDRNHPPEIALLENGIVRELTRSFDGLPPAFESRVVQWKSKDGEDMEGMLWLPIGYRDGTRVPLLTELHGGPTGVTLDSFPTPSVYPIQSFLEKGIAVFSPNFRGSTNYGAEIRMKNAKSQGEGDYQDVMTGIDSLITKGIADEGRLGIAGWSYGGYLTASIVTQTNRFKAASIGAPATDWITYYGQSDGPKEVLWSYFGGTPWEVPESYNRHSPRAKLKDVRTPCLLQVGVLDINHNAEIYRALTDNGVEAVYTVYAREGHGFAEPAHVHDVMQRNLAWFLRHLAPTSPPRFK